MDRTGTGQTGRSAGTRCVKSPATWPLPVFGLTGCIGSGKSTLARKLALMGAGVIDADRTGHRLLSRGRPCHRLVVKRFGTGVLLKGGRIDRSALARVVFEDVQARRDLEAILHPAIMAAVLRRVRRMARVSPCIVILEAALLVQSGWHALVDDVIWVEAREELVLERLRNGRGMATSAALSRLKAQASRRDPSGFARWVVDNDGSLRDLDRKATWLWSELSGHPASRRLGGTGAGRPRGL